MEGKFSGCVCVAIRQRHPSKSYADDSPLSPPPTSLGHDCVKTAASHSVPIFAVTRADEFCGPGLR